MSDQNCCKEATPEKVKHFLKAVKPAFEKEFPECAAKLKDCCSESCCE